MAGDGQSDAQFMARRSLNTAQAFQEHLDGDQATAEMVKQLCEAAWDAGWYSNASGLEVSNPFRGERGRS